jgi:hypothetical protein
MTREDKNKSKAHYKQHTYGMWWSLLLIAVISATSILFKDDLNPHLLIVAVILCCIFYYYSILNKSIAKNSILMYQTILYINSQNYYLKMILELIETEEGKVKAIDIYNKHAINKRESTLATFILGVFAGAKCEGIIDNTEYHQYKKLKF